jgi:hypothetical protein
MSSWFLVEPNAESTPSVWSGPFELWGGNPEHRDGPAYPATDLGRPASMADVVRATASEYRKRGRLSGHVA